MHPRQVQQYIVGKLGEFDGLLLTRRSIVLSLEKYHNTFKPPKKKVSIPQFLGPFYHRGPIGRRSWSRTDHA